MDGNWYLEGAGEFFVSPASGAGKSLARVNRQESRGLLVKTLTLIAIGFGGRKIYQWIKASLSESKSRKAQSESVNREAVHFYPVCTADAFDEKEELCNRNQQLLRENGDLKKMISTLQAELKTSNIQLQSNKKINDQNKQLWSENGNLRRTISTLQAESQKVMVTKNQLNSLLFERNNEIKQKDRQIKDMKTSNIQQQSNYNKLKQTHAQQIKKRDNELQRLKSELGQLKSLGANPNPECNICMTRRKVVMAFNPCGHMACDKCASKLTDCHMCRKKIACRIRLYIQ